ncbi:hypothetical protein Sjap_017398 [Stephania japonica]|uniref:Uncharacterized protein n=1 Tax=Stephania japonica TaxID=461633 RepID=A0AAP0I668_9MAGN
MVHEEDENSLRNRRTLDAALHFRCTPRENVIVDDAFEMANQVIAFLSGCEDTYQTTVSGCHSEGGTTSS